MPCEGLRRVRSRCSDFLRDAGTRRDAGRDDHAGRPAAHRDTRQIPGDPGHVRHGVESAPAVTGVHRPDRNRDEPVSRVRRPDQASVSRTNPPSRSVISRRNAPDRSGTRTGCPTAASAGWTSRFGPPRESRAAGAPGSDRLPPRRTDGPGSGRPASRGAPRAVAAGPRGRAGHRHRGWSRPSRRGEAPRGSPCGGPRPCPRAGVPQHFAAPARAAARRSRPSRRRPRRSPGNGPASARPRPQRRHLVEHRNDRPERAGHAASLATRRRREARARRASRRGRGRGPAPSAAVAPPGLAGLREAEILTDRLGEVRQRHHAGAGNGERRRGGPEPAQARVLADQRGQGGQPRAPPGSARATRSSSHASWGGGPPP